VPDPGREGRHCTGGIGVPGASREASPISTAARKRAALRTTGTRRGAIPSTHDDDGLRRIKEPDGDQIDAIHNHRATSSARANVHLANFHFENDILRALSERLNMQGIACSVQRTSGPARAGAILSHLERLLEAMVKSLSLLSLIFALCFTLQAAAPEEKSPRPQYDSKGNLLRPADYRDWMFLSAGTA